MIENQPDIGSPQPLSKKIFRGVVWVFTLRLIVRGLGFVKTVILARLLAPEDFGVLGIAMLAVSTVETFSQSGFNAAIIQKMDNTKSSLDTAWTVSAIRGALLFCILFFAAPLVASFFELPQAILVIKVIAITTLVSGFTNIGILFFQRELDFKRQFLYGFFPTLINLIVGITLAFMLRSVWALVWGVIAGSVIGLVLSYALHSYRPRIDLNKHELRDLFSFGKWLLASTILVFLLTKGDDILVGKMLGATALGLYQMAYLISNLPTTEIVHVVSQVTFPAYSKLHNDAVRVSEAYHKVLQLTAFFSFPLAGLIFVTAPEFTRLFLGEKWLSMVPAMQVLCIFGVSRSINANFGVFFLGIGKPDVSTKASFGQLIIMAIIIYPLSLSWGIYGTSIAIIVPNMLILMYLCNKLYAHPLFPLKSFLKQILIPLGCATVAVIGVSILKACFNSVLFKFCFALIAGTFLYLSCIYFMERFVNYGIGNNIRKITSNI